MGSNVADRGKTQQSRVPEKEMRCGALPRPPGVRCPSLHSRGDWLRIDEDAGVEDAVGVDGFFGGAEGVGEKLGALLVVAAGAVQAADGVVVGDGAAVGVDGGGGGVLDRLPLLGFRARSAEAGENIQELSRGPRAERTSRV